MKQFFEVFFGVIIIMIAVYLSAQGVLTNTQISTAREYHATCIERIENTGLSEDYIKDLVEYTNHNTDYVLTVDKVTGVDHTASYHVSLKYPIRNVIYTIFGSRTEKFAVIDGFASVGKTSPSLEDREEAAHGQELDHITLGTDVTGTFYSDGYLIISGNGSTITATNAAWSAIKNEIEYVAIKANVTKIPDSLFSGLPALSGVSLGKVQEIGQKAFSNCPQLNSLLVPRTVTKIGSQAFANCVNLKYVYVNNREAQVNIAADTLNGCTNDPQYIFLL